MLPVGSSNHIDNMEHHVGLRAKKVIPFVDDGSGNAVMEITNTLAVRYIVDSTTSTTYYVCKAAAGSLESDPVWQIAKLDKLNKISITWADGNTDFDNTYNNREALTYT